MQFRHISAKTQPKTSNNNANGGGGGGPPGLPPWAGGKFFGFDFPGTPFLKFLGL